jgi:hypothetical protein
MSRADDLHSPPTHKLHSTDAAGTLLVLLEDRIGIRFVSFPVRLGWGRLALGRERGWLID